MKRIGLLLLPIATVLLLVLATNPFAFAQARHVQWDIISFVFSAPPTLNPGGFAFALTDDGARIKLTGSGAFVAPAAGGSSSAATGGGTWETLNTGGVITGSGTYVVTGLVRFEFANLQTGIFIDNIGDTNERANGTAVVRIRYSDGDEGILGIGCHGPGAPDGIDEGVIATKGFETYWNSQNPPPAADANRTLFHVRQ